MEDITGIGKSKNISCIHFVMSDVILANVPSGGTKGIFCNKYKNLGRMFIFRMFILPL